MEKKNFIALIMSVIGGMLFALGMCMCLVSEWGTFNQGVVLGVIGVIELFITWMVYRKMSGKQPIKLNAKVIGKVIYGIIAAIVFGIGMRREAYEEKVIIYDKDGAREQEVNYIPVRAI